MCGYRVADREQCGYGDLDETVWEFGRAIVLWGFKAVPQFRADSDIDLYKTVLVAELALMKLSQHRCRQPQSRLQPVMRINPPRLEARSTAST